MAINNRYLSAGAAMLALVGSAVAADFWGNAIFAQETFPDVPPDYWATPFIQVLAREGIITGYPDGTYRPQQQVEREEFAAIVRQAFERDQEREIPSASTFEDVPQGYWAETPIEEAYETGFMNETSENSFSPEQPMTKVEALMALTRGLEASYATPNPTAQSAAQTGSRNRPAKNGIAFPLATTAIMMPLVKAAAPILPVAQTAQGATPEPNTTAPSSTESAIEPDASVLLPTNVVQFYYEDAAQIPEDAIEDVATATKRGIVVNYPDQNYLQPSQPLDRGTTAALVHQSLVNIGQLQPLAQDSEASNYIVGPFSEEELANKLQKSN